jgi:UDP-N-acetylmuramate--alanine ligase
LAAKQGWDRRLVVLFQPHRYTRTRDCFEDFTHAFDRADLLFMTDIYPAGEAPIPGVSGAKLAEAIAAAGHSGVTFIERKDTLPDQVLPHLKPGDLVLTLGAGDIWKAGMGILDRLASAS